MINYPTGQQPSFSKHNNNKRTSQSKQTIYSSRGMSLEDRLNQSNEYYLQRQIAAIHKKPTPVQVVSVDYPRRSQARITEAYYRHASTTDYNGVYHGYYLDFEAKETKNKTSFPLSNIPDHQLNHMRQCVVSGGIVFLILSFHYHQEVYLIPYLMVDQFIRENKKKSLPYKFIKENAYLCKTGIAPLIDYLEAVDRYLIDKDSLLESED